jgi:hypothetical protein
MDARPRLQQLKLDLSAAATGSSAPPGGVSRAYRM